MLNRLQLYSIIPFNGKIVNVLRSLLDWLSPVFLLIFVENIRDSHLHGKELIIGEFRQILEICETSTKAFCLWKVSESVKALTTYIPRREWLSPHSCKLFNKKKYLRTLSAAVGLHLLLFSGVYMLQLN